MPETELYTPVKQFLEAQGYEVKGEIGPCDVMAVRGDEEPVVVELKENFNLALVLQAVDRLAFCDTVYVAFRIGNAHSASWRTRRKQVLRLLRRLGLGLLTVSTRGKVVAALDPAPYRPKPQTARRKKLLREFAERIGDPEDGGSSPRRRLTAYRQDVLRCAVQLDRDGVLKASVLKQLTGVDRAGTILRDNHYGWFERVKAGYYVVTKKGKRELSDWTAAIEQLDAASESNKKENE